MKNCPSCGEMKNLSEFYIRQNEKPSCYCIFCERRKAKENYQSDPEKFKARNRVYYLADRDNRILKAQKYYEDNKEKINEKKTIWHEANKERNNEKSRIYNEINKEKRKTQRIKTMYNLSLEEYKAIPNICAIPSCHSTIGLGVDHNHDTGVVREKLCVRHNTGLGLFHDDPAELVEGATYLWQHDTEQRYRKEKQ